LVDAEYRRRRASVASLIEAEIEARRRGGGDPGDGVLGRRATTTIPMRSAPIVRPPQPPMR
jgi:hypothetical protein